jgi:hypothetical protein
MQGGKSSKRQKGKPYARKGYSTVPRTRGVYAKGEMKYFDSEMDYTVSASTDWTATEADPTATPVAAINTLFCPTQGAAINQRIGRECFVKKIKINGVVTVATQTNQTAADIAGTLRLILFQDTQTNASQAQGEQLMTAPVGNTAILANSSFQSLNNFGRFKVLKDKRWALAHSEIVYDGTNVEQSGFHIPFKFVVNYPKGVPVRFNATNGGTIADIVDNSWHLLAQATEISLAPHVQYQCRVCFREDKP